MKFIQIIKDGKNLDRFQAETEAELMAWLQVRKDHGIFGKEAYDIEVLVDAVPAVTEEQTFPAVTEEREILDEEGQPTGEFETVVITPEETRTVIITPEIPEHFETQTIPAEYSYVIDDVAPPTAQELALEQRLKNESFGKEFMRWITMLNESSGITPEQVIALRQDNRIRTAKDLCDGGDIISLHTFIESTDWTGLFPPAVRTMAIQKIDAFLGA